MFVELARAAERRIGQFDSQNLANTAWAFAKAGHRSEVFFAALARAAERRTGELSPYTLASKV